MARHLRRSLAGPAAAAAPFPLRGPSAGVLREATPLATKTTPQASLTVLRGLRFTHYVLLPLRLPHLLKGRNRHLQHLLVGFPRGQGLERQVGFDNEAYKG